MQLLRSPDAYTNWVNGPWNDVDSTVVPVQERLSRNPYAPVRGRDGQRFPWRANVLSVNALTPQMGLNTPKSGIPMGVQRYLKSNVAHKKPLFVKGVEGTVPSFTWAGLDTFERKVANQ